MEAKIEKAEARVGELEAQMVEPAVATDAAKLQETWTALEQAKAEVERLYARWEDLEARQNR
jgi:ATP-binding cassette subfamily F protein uup